jgi:hypothetical protein
MSLEGSSWVSRKYGIWVSLAKARETWITVKNLVEMKQSN